MAKYVVGDVHGCAKTLKSLLENQIKLRPIDKVFLLGDLIDRGPDSKGVLDYIFLLLDNDFDIQVLRGNHEEMFLQALSDEHFKSVWLMNGGDAVLNNFGISEPAQIPEKYRDFFYHLPFYLSVDNFLLVHAGFDFSSEYIYKNKNAMLWIRKFKVNPQKTENKIVLHGHTPQRLQDINTEITCAREQFEIGLDNGCVFKNTPFLGNLCGLRLEDLKLFVQPNIED